MFFSGPNDMWSSLQKTSHRNSPELFISPEKTSRRWKWQNMSPRGCSKYSVSPIKAVHREIYYVRSEVSEWGERLSVWPTTWLMDEVYRRSEWVTRTKNRQRQRAPKTSQKARMTWLNEVEREEQAPQKLRGRGETKSSTPTATPEMKKQSHTCFQFPPNWNSVMNNGRLCETENENEKQKKKKEENENQDGVCNIGTSCVSVFQTLSFF